MDMALQRDVSTKNVVVTVNLFGEEWMCVLLLETARIVLSMI
jgi:hypothetical protein